MNPYMHSTGLRNFSNELKSSQKVYAVFLANFSSDEERLSYKL